MGIQARFLLSILNLYLLLGLLSFNVFSFQFCGFFFNTVVAHSEYGKFCISDWMIRN